MLSDLLTVRTVVLSQNKIHLLNTGITFMHCILTSLLQVLKWYQIILGLMSAPSVDEFVIAAGQAGTLRKEVSNIKDKFQVSLVIPNEKYDDSDAVWIKLRGPITNVSKAKVSSIAFCNRNFYSKQRYSYLRSTVWVCSVFLFSHMACLVAGKIIWQNAAPRVTKGHL